MNSLNFALSGQTDQQRNWQQKLSDRLKYKVLGQDEPERPRIIGIGLAKTGTSSLCDALSIIGFRTIHYPPIMRVIDQQVEFYWPWWMSRYEAMADVPAAMFFRELDAKFPNSKFILTVRDLSKWLKSCERHFNPKASAAANKVPKFQAAQLLNRQLYNGNVFDPQDFEATYKSHYAAVTTHFAHRQNFMVMDICDGEGWEKLCPFVDRPVPDIDFPISNSRKG